MKNYIQGGDTKTFVLVVACSAGDLVNIGPALSGVAMNDGEIGDEIAIKVGGVYEVEKTTSLAIAIGEEVYFNTTTKKVTKTKTDVCLGVAWKAAASNDTTIEVLLAPKRGEQNLAESQAAVVAAIPASTNIPAVAGGATPTAGQVDTALAVAESRLDTAEAKVNELIAALKTAGIMATA